MFYSRHPGLYNVYIIGGAAWVPQSIRPGLAAAAAAAAA